jgi:hypothetical protein
MKTLEQKESLSDMARMKANWGLGLTPSTPSATPEQKSRLENRLISPVRDEMANSLRKVSEAIEEEDWLKAYRGIFEYATLGVFGENGINAIDWSKPPKNGRQEKKQLDNLRKVSDYFQQRDSKIGQILDQLPALSGKKADKEGLYANPELLHTLSTVEINIRAIEDNCPPLPTDRRHTDRIADLIIAITNGYADGNRDTIADAIFHFEEAVREYFQHKKMEKQIVPKLEAIHPFFGKLAQKFLSFY